MILRRLFYILFFFTLLLSGCKSWKSTGDTVNPEIKEGNIHLTVNEKKASYSLFYLLNPNTTHSVPLLNSSEQPASFTSISVDGKVTKLGEGKFKARLVNNNGYPALMYESSTVTVTQTFTPVRTVNSSVVNGVMVTYAVQNSSDRDYSVGLRIFIDTILGEGRGMVPFYLNNNEVRGETLIERNSGTLSWVSRNNNFSLMGSTGNPLDYSQKSADYVHIANWRRLYSSSWKLKFTRERSLGTDSAVCYLFEPSLLERGKTFNYTIFLTAEDDAYWYFIRENPSVESPSMPQSPVITEPPVIVPPFKFDMSEIEYSAIIQSQQSGESIDDIILLKLHDILNQFINGEIDLSERDLSDIESAINRYHYRSY